MSLSPTTQRGMILLEQRRYPEAEKYFRDSLAQEPNDAFTLYHLAICQMNQQQHQKALETLERGLALEPDLADFHSLRAMILVDLHRTKDALAASEEALRLDPDSDFAYTARASAFLSKNEWATAEVAAKKALELNPDNGLAANQLAHALRLQNRLTESAEQSRYMLTQDPEDADNHTTAGWIALQRGDHRKAEEHFLESLRLEANNESARQGLKESFKARAPLYRAYLKYCFFMQRFTEGQQWMLIIGLLLLQRFAREFLPGPAALAVMGLYLLFVLFVHVASALGDFQLMFDRFARHALRMGERLRAVFVGGGVVLGLIALAAGLIMSLPPAVIAGVTLIGASFPLAYTFTNASPGGRVFFGAAALVVYAAGAANFTQSLTGQNLGEWVSGLTTVATLAVIAVTWLANVRALNRPR